MHYITTYNTFYLKRIQYTFIYINSEYSKIPQLILAILLMLLSPVYTNIAQINLFINK